MVGRRVFLTARPARFVHPDVPGYIDPTVAGEVAERLKATVC